MKDPEKMSGPHRTLVLDHWRCCQAMGQIALKFKLISSGPLMLSPQYKPHLQSPLVSESIALHIPLPLEDSANNLNVLSPGHLDNYGTDNSLEPSNVLVGALDAGTLPSLPVQSQSRPADSNTSSNAPVI